MPNLGRIEDPQVMEVHVNGPGNANRLFIFAGTAVFNWHVTNDDAWDRESLWIPLSLIPECPVIWAEQVVSHVATVSLASIRFRESARRDTVGFAADSIHARFTRRAHGDVPETGLEVFLALRGEDAFFYRVNFQLNVLAHI